MKKGYTMKTLKPVKSFVMEEIESNLRFAVLAIFEDRDKPQLLAAFTTKGSAEAFVNKAEEIEKSYKRTTVTFETREIVK